MNRDAPAPNLGVRFLAALSPLAAFLVAGMANWLAGLVACGGDGGSPYAAPGSPRAHFCDHAFGPLAIASLFLAPGVATLGSMLLLRRRRWLWFALTALLGLAIAVAPLLIGDSLDG